VEISLADFDPAIVAQYAITEQDLQQIARYVQLLQGEDAPTLADIAVGGYYGTSALLHEVVELRALLEREPELLNWQGHAVRQFFHANPDVHANALVVEHRYLQACTENTFGQRLSLEALVTANAGRRDFELLLVSDIPVPIFEPSLAEVQQAELLLERLRSLGKVMK
jgi:hypothetical protein